MGSFMAKSKDIKYKRKKKFHPTLLILLLVAGIAAAGFLFYYISARIPSNKHEDAAEYFGISNEDEVGITAGATVASERGITQNGSIYLPVDVVSASVNPGFYYEDTDQLLIVTTPTEKTVLDLTSGTSSGNEAVTIDGQIYVALDYLEKMSDIEVSTYDSPSRVVIKRVFDYAAGTLKEDTAIRKEPSIKADIIKDGAKGDTLRLLDVSSDGTAADEKTENWTNVVTDDGYVGYVEDDELTDIREQKDQHTSPIGEYTTQNDGTPVNMVFHQTTSQASNNAFSEATANVSGVNTIAPTWFFLNNNKGEMTSIASSAYVTAAHNAGMKVWAVMNDFDGGVNSSESTASALSTEAYRSAMINTVMQGLEESGADGLNVDFERVNKDSAPAFLELVRELSVECRNRGLVLSIDNYVPTFTSYMGRGEQARVADYVVTMCYDEHSSGSEEAGSVASLPFLTKGLEDTLKSVPSSKLIAAIPFFTRMWTTDGSGSPESTAYGMEDAKAAADSLGMELSWDKNLGQNYGEVESNGTKYQIWMEDEESVEAKMKEIQSLNIAGVAEWKLGQENSDVWPIISSYMK